MATDSAVPAESPLQDPSKVDSPISQPVPSESAVHKTASSSSSPVRPQNDNNKNRGKDKSKKKKKKREKDPFSEYRRHQPDPGREVNVGRNRQAKLPAPRKLPPNVGQKVTLQMIGERHVWDPGVLPRRKGTATSTIGG